METRNRDYFWERDRGWRRGCSLPEFCSWMPPPSLFLLHLFSIGLLGRWIAWTHNQPTRPTISTNIGAWAATYIHETKSQDFVVILGLWSLLCLDSFRRLAHWREMCCSYILQHTHRLLLEQTTEAISRGWDLRVLSASWGRAALSTKYPKVRIRFDENGIPLLFKAS